MTDKISDDDDFPRDTCFTCNVSPTAAERSGRQWAIDTLRAGLAHHLNREDDPCTDRGVEWPCDVADAFESLSDGSQT